MTHRQRRWTNIETTLGQVLVFAGRAVGVLKRAGRLCMVATGYRVICVKEGLGISYNDVLLIRDFWVVNDIKHSSDCPYELASDIPAIAVVDNADFKSDTLTGAGQSHRTNVMFVQPESSNT